MSIDTENLDGRPGFYWGNRSKERHREFLAVDGCRKGVGSSYRRPASCANDLGADASSIHSPVRTPGVRGGIGSACPIDHPIPSQGVQLFRAQLPNDSEPRRPS